MQRREQGTRLDDESAAGDLLYSAGDAKAVHFAGDEGLQDEQVQGSLQEGGWCGRQEILL
jgi:hypothetical protein